MPTIRAFLKFVAFIFFISFYLFSALLIILFTSYQSKIRYLILSRIVSIFCKLGAFIFNFKISFKNPKNINISQRSLWVGNHLSYLDIIALTNFKNSLFVTSKDMQQTPGLGLLCEMAGCYFVDRKNRHNLRNEIHDIARIIEKSPSLTFFPEAQATNGDQVIKFRSPLFESAILSNSKIIPFCINYISINSNPITVQNRDLIFWYGDMTFIGHFWNFLKCKEVSAEITVLDEISPQNATRDDLCQKSYQAIVGNFRPISS